MLNIPHSNSTNSLELGFLNQFVNQEFIEDIINVAIYQADIDTFGQRTNRFSSMSQIEMFLTDTLKDLNKLRKVNSLGTYPIQVIKSNIVFAKRIIDLRGTISNNLLTYDTILNNFQNIDAQTLNLVKRVIDNQIRSVDEYKTKLSTILSKIQIGNEIKSIKTGLTLLDSVRNNLNQRNCQILDSVIEFRNAIDVMSGELNKLRSINVSESLSNSIIIGGSDYKPDNITNNIITYLSNGYAFYKSGYELIDNCVGGIEAANLHLICGPSNNAKSIFMINLLRLMILNNRNEFEPNDIVLYITLEDDIYKLLRRFGAILGNTEQSVLKYLYVSLASLLKNKDLKQEEQNGTLTRIRSLLNNFINNSLYESVGKFAPFDLKHYREQITPNTIKQIIEYHKSHNRRVRMCFIDYIDCMTPSSSKYTSYDDYNSHGIITQELRNIAQEFLVPIITITQAVRGTESTDFMSNDNIGDSIKKVRYSDYIYMVRLRRDLQILAENVKKDIIEPSELEETKSTTFTDLENGTNSKLVPFEITITKAKDGDRGISKFHVFSPYNLKIYDKLSSYYADIPTLKTNTDQLRAEIERARMDIQSIGALSNNNILF